MGVRYSGPLVGRGSELERLDAALARALAGEAAVALVGGEAGVGKSRLVAESAEHARRAGARVLSGACIQVGEESLPYAPISDALRPLLRELDPAALDELVGPRRSELARLLPELGRPRMLEEDGHDGRSVQAQLFELVLGLLERLAARAPLLLVVEDLHWADRSSLELLAFLVHGLGAAPVMLLATYRSDELHRRHRLRPVLAELDRNPTVERFELARLAGGDLAELLAGRLGRRPEPEVVERILRRSEGNPLFAEELLEAELRDEAGMLPVTLQDLLTVRVEVLSEPARQVLRLAALVGRRAGHRLLAAACSLEQDVLLAALREAVDAQVLVVDQATDGYAFRHALLQEAVEADVLPGERQLQHGILARTLAAHPELGSVNPAEAATEIATHWHASGNQRQALLAAVEAGRQARAALAFAEAQRQLERALDLWERAPAAVAELAAAEPPLDRVALLEQAAEAAYSAGEDQRAVALGRAALAGVDQRREPVRAGLLCERLGRYLWVSANDESLALYRRAVDLVPAEPPSRARARVLAGQAHILNLTSRMEASRARAEEAVTAARRAGARREEAYALVMLGTAVGVLGGDHQAGLAHLREGRRIAAELADAEVLGLAFVFLPQVLEGAGRLPEALSEAVDAVEALRPLGVERSFGGFLRGLAANLCFRLGRWEEAERYGRQALATAPVASVAAVHARLWQARLEVERGELDAAAGRLDEAERAVAGSRAPQFVSSIGELRAALAVWQGRPEEAGAAVGRTLEQLAGAEEEDVFRSLLTLGLRAEADRAEQARARRLASEADDAVRAGEALLGRLREVVERASTAGTGPEPETAACAALGEAEATRLQGPPDPERWAAVAAAWERLGQPYRAAYARWREAEALLAERGPRQRAAAALRQAHQVASELGAAPLRSETEALARRARIDLDVVAAAPAGQAAEPSPAERLGLTRREREVLALVASGRTNRQIADELFISVKTAGIHVSNILAKLGVASRVEAAAVAHRGGLVDHPAP